MDSINSYDSCKLLYNNPVGSESEGILFRSRLQSAARRIGFADGKRENMALVAMEMVTNQVKHAGCKGFLQIWEQPGPALDLVALDFGPGIPNLADAQQDGYSTTNTLGKGLGSIRRLSDESAVYSLRPGESKDGKWAGSLFWARFLLNGRAGARKDAPVPQVLGEGLKLGLFSRALADDRYNGDRVYIHKQNGRLCWLHLDGLGHGSHAHETVSHLGNCLVRGKNVQEVLAHADRQLATTRGAVAIVCEIDLSGRTAELVGVGDMGASFYSAEKLQNLTFAPGVLGKEHKTPQVSRLDYDKKCTVVTTSDGIRRSWKQDSFPGLFNHHPQVVAYLLGNIMGRAADDQSVCVVRAGEK